MISDFIDVINSDRVAGWCFDGDCIETAVTLEFYADGRRLGDTVAGQHRPDLKAVGFHPTGYCGFEYCFPDGVDLERFSTLTIRVAGRDNPVKEFATESIQRVIRGDGARVFFMHIPKTAGTSFNTFAESVFPAGSAAIHIESLGREQYPMIAATRSYVAGHLPLREIKAGFDLNRFELVTILREPWSHLHSHLNWVKNIGVDPASDFFLAHSEETRELALLLNRLDFSNAKNLDLLVDGICGDLTSLFDNHQTRYFLDYRRIRVSEADVDMARRALSLFSQIGCTERYTDFIDQFCRRHGIDQVQSTPSFNVARAGRIFDHTDPEVRSTLLPFVKYDLQLYAEVCDGHGKQFVEPY